MTRESSDGQATNLGNLGGIAKARGEVDNARWMWSESRDLYVRIGMPHMSKMTQEWLDALPPN